MTQIFVVTTLNRFKMSMSESMWRVKANIPALTRSYWHTSFHMTSCSVLLYLFALFVSFNSLQILGFSMRPHLI